MTLLPLAFVAGVLTVLAPCILPILPIIVGGSFINGHKSRPRVVILSFALSILLFTLLIQRLFDQFGLMRETITQVSAIILIFFGLFFLFPQIRQRITHITWIEQASAKAQASTWSWVWGDVLLGASLWPVFNSCSPTYAFVVATILPASFAQWLLIILAYIAGLCGILWLIARGGYRVSSKLRWVANPQGRFRKILAIVIIIVGISIFMKRDKNISTRIIDKWRSLDATQRELLQIPTGVQ